MGAGRRRVWLVATESDDADVDADEMNGGLMILMLSCNERFGA